jgi:phage-related tail fiber protein
LLRPIEGTTLVTIPASDLHAGGKPLSKVVRLQANDLADNMQAVIKVVVADGENNVVTDVRPENNFVPVSLYSEDGSLVTIPGDVNRDGAVDSGDIMTVYGIMAGNYPSTSACGKAAAIKSPRILWRFGDYFVFLHRIRLWASLRGSETNSK